MQTIGSPALWGGFLTLVLVMLAVDLGIFHRKAHEVSFKEALGWSIVWVALSGAFAVGIYIWFGAQRALEFTTGYLLEKALSVDNIFVFVVIFSSFGVPPIYQHRVLFWGILGALIMRAIFIVAGAALLQRFHWAIYVFGGVLIITGLKLLLQRDAEPDVENNVLVRWVRRVMPLTSKYDGGHFFVRDNGKRYGTTLLLALVVVEFSDVIFALDSVPAIFAITNDPFIVFTSNIFAILGLRSLYFLLAGIVKMFVYLKVGLSMVLIFVGAKMALMDVYKLPIVASLAIIATILAGSIGASMLRTSRERAREMRASS